MSVRYRKKISLLQKTTRVGSTAALGSGAFLDFACAYKITATLSTPFLAGAF
jgi:hypothetical protein